MNWGRTQKTLPYLKLLMIMILFLDGCTSSQHKTPDHPILSATIQTAITSATPSISPTVFFSPTVKTPTSMVVASETPKPFDTLEPTQAYETIQALSRENCAAPCFWGIVPGKTSFREANQLLLHLGLPVFNSTIQGKNYSNYQYNFDANTEVNITLAIQNNMVESTNVVMGLEDPKSGTETVRSNYFPEKLIQRYGKPSNVFFYADLNPPATITIVMYFDQYDLIVEADSDHGPDLKSFRICPATLYYEGLRIWMGKNPYHPPVPGISLEKAASLTIDQFTQLMMGDPNQACMNLNIDAFRPK